MNENDTDLEESGQSVEDETGETTPEEDADQQ